MILKFVCPCQWNCPGKEVIIPSKWYFKFHFSRLKLQDKNLKDYNSATENEISTFWSSIIALDECLEEGGVHR